MITKYKIFESLRDKMKPKSEDELLNNISNLGSLKELNKALIESTKLGDLKLVKMLIDKGADINYANSSPLSIAVYNRHYDIVKYLLENEIEVNDPSYLLTLVVSNDDVEMLKLLSEYIDIHTNDQAAIKESIVRNKYDIVKYLLENGASMIMYNDGGIRTLIDYAISNSVDYRILNLLNEFYRKNYYKK